MFKKLFFVSLPDRRNCNLNSAIGYWEEMKHLPYLEETFKSCMLGSYRFRFPQLCDMLSMNKAIRSQYVPDQVEQTYPPASKKSREKLMLALDLFQFFGKNGVQLLEGLDQFYQKIPLNYLEARKQPNNKQFLRKTFSELLDQCENLHVKNSLFTGILK